MAIDSESTVEVSQVPAAGNAKVVTELFQRLTLGSTQEERRGAASDLAGQVNASDVTFLKTNAVIDKIQAAAVDKKKTEAREGAMLAIISLCETVGAPCEPFVMPLLGLVLDTCADKQVSVRTVAENAGKALLKLVSPFGVANLMPVFFDALTVKKKWQTKKVALELLASLTTVAPKQIRYCLPDIIPHVSDTMWDTKPEVKAAATTTMNEVCRVVDNQDIDQFIPALIGTIADPSQVSECVRVLAATTFVKAVEAPALAIMVPLLVRGLSERNTAVMRQTAVIIDNMCKLVENPSEAELFLPKLLPGLDRNIEMGADPEMRNTTNKARTTLLKARGDGTEIDNLAILKKVGAKENVFKWLKEIVTSVAKPAQFDQYFTASLEYIAACASLLVNLNDFEAAEWKQKAVVPYLTTFISAKDADAVCQKFLDKCIAECKREKEGAKGHEEEEPGEDLCKCEFSLAYGGMILLNNTGLHLKRGHRYGLCGPNGCGKSTLMRAISKGQVDGFPSPDELKTVFVEHNLQAEEADFPVLDFICNSEDLKTVPRETIKEELSSVGFTEEMQQQPVGSLSGGWKMKLELARAMLMKADILLLDEPTNHLDVKNVAWLVNYLNGLTNVTCMIVSHDSDFLDNVCTNIIHYENRKLKQYRGNLAEFVKVKPEAKAYYELASENVKFVLPEPGFLDGINSKDKAILKMMKVGFTYPNTTRKILSDVMLQCSLSSRVACIGPNGAGKSTLIKILTGELVADEGDVWKHPALRVAYVAQHAFHHLEQHLDKTPNQYIQWRYQFGEDKELMAKQSRQLTPEEEKMMNQKIVIEGEKRQWEMFVGRRKLKRSYEYEVKWQGLPYDMNTWMTRDKLEELGFTKMLQTFDDKEAARAGMYNRPLTQKEVEKHLFDLGLDPEFATHSHISGLSGGQKVKVVIGAAMWNNPHMLVLDEPTNYLDRDSLGALAGAIREYGGGVVMISHHNEFTSALCPEKWTVGDGKCIVTGATNVIKEKIVQEEKTEAIDAFGNVIKLKSTKKLSRKEQKAREKRRAAAKKRGEEVSDSEDDI